MSLFAYKCIMQDSAYIIKTIQYIQNPCPCSSPRSKQDQKLLKLDFFSPWTFGMDGREIEQESPLLRTKCLSRREQLRSPLEVLFLKKGFYFPAFSFQFCLFFHYSPLFFYLHLSASAAVCCLPNSTLISHYENGR